MKESSLNPLNVTPRKLDNTRDASMLKLNQNEEQLKSDGKKGKPSPHEVGKNWNIASHKPAPKLNILGNQKISIGPSLADPTLVPQLVPKGIMEFQKEAPDGSIGKDGSIDLEPINSSKTTNKIPLEISTSTRHNKSNNQTSSIHCNINNHSAISNNERRFSINRSKISKTTINISCSQSSTSSMTSTKNSIEYTSERRIIKVKSKSKSKSKSNAKTKPKSVGKVKSKSNKKCKSAKKSKSPRKNRVSAKEEKPKSKKKVRHGRHSASAKSTGPRSKGSNRSK